MLAYAFILTPGGDLDAEKHEALTAAGMEPLAADSQFIYRYDFYE